jgi:hypothetical protein
MGPCALRRRRRGPHGPLLPSFPSPAGLLLSHPHPPVPLPRPRRIAGPQHSTKPGPATAPTPTPRSPNPIQQARAGANRGARPALPRPSRPPRRSGRRWLGPSGQAARPAAAPKRPAGPRNPPVSVLAARPLTRGGLLIVHSRAPPPTHHRARGPLPVSKGRRRAAPRLRAPLAPPRLPSAPKRAHAGRRGARRDPPPAPAAAPPALPGAVAAPRRRALVSPKSRPRTLLPAAAAQPCGRRAGGAGAPRPSFR